MTCTVVTSGTESSLFAVESIWSLLMLRSIFPLAAPSLPLRIAVSLVAGCFVVEAAAPLELFSAFALAALSAVSLFLFAIVDNSSLFRAAVASCDPEVFDADGRARPGGVRRS